MDTKILIIEDDPAIQTGLKEMLLLENYKLFVSSDGQEGMDLALKEDPDLIILDINLPTMNGLEVCRILREKNFLNSIIMLTSKNEQVDEIIGLELGANDYITKPFDSRELLARIHSQLRVLKRVSQINIENQKGITKGESRRRLLAVMFTDMKDYSKKMGNDENLTIKLLGIHNEMIKKIVNNYKGKVVEIIGDAFLVTFENALKSVECGYEIQNQLKAYNNKVSVDEQIEVRIGIHLGDVIESEIDVKGDAVNIAARIQQNAIAGGVTISKEVFSAVKNKVNFNIVYLGEKNFKNIKEPVLLYDVEIINLSG